MAEDHGLAPLPYHRAIAAFLKRLDSKTWDWFASNGFRETYAESVRLELLKSTFRLEPSAYPALFESARVAGERLGFSKPLTIYQAQASEGLNLFLLYLPAEAHIVISGPVIDTLDRRNHGCRRA